MNLNLFPVRRLQQPNTIWRQASATSTQTTTSGSMVDIPDMSVTLTLIRPAIVVAMMSVTVYGSASNQIINARILGPGATAIGLLQQHVTDSANRPHNLVPMGIALCPAGNNVFKGQWSTGSATATVTQRCLLAFVLGGF
jgi:hypothetical protein